MPHRVAKLDESLMANPVGRADPLAGRHPPVDYPDSCPTPAHLPFEGVPLAPSVSPNGGSRPPSPSPEA
jgi:hypothetical protein